MGSLAAHLASVPADSRAVRSMLSVAPHRGTKLSVLRVGSVWLGVANSDFVDATIAERDGWGVAVQGPLDNLAELCASLEDLGYRPDELASPATCVLACFRAWRDDAWPRLRGDAAIVVTDGSRIWAVRDPGGAATLFVRHRHPSVFIASEAKQVVAGAGLSREPDLAALGRHFFGAADAYEEPPCQIKGVERVPRASVAEFDVDGQARVHRYWDPSGLVGTSRLSADEVREALSHHLGAAVERMTDRTTVVALSGGIDSPAIAAFASESERRRGRRLKALSTLYPNAPTVDEARYIKAVVEQLDLEWRFFEPTYRQLDDLQLWVDRFDGPVPSVDTPAVSEFYGHVREFGGQSVLFGELAELVIDLRGHLVGDLILHGHWATAGRLLKGKHDAGTRWASILRSVLPSLTPAPLASWYVRHRGQEQARLTPWIDPAFVPGLDSRWDLAQPVLRRWSDIQLYFAMAPSNPGVEAASIVGASLDVHLRRPFTDVDLWEFLLGLPAHRKYPEQTSKSIVRDALRGRLPDIVLDRTDKTGFNEDIRQRVDIPGMRRWILETDFRMPGIRYDVIDEMLERDEIGMWDLSALRHLASIHAFVDLFQ